MINEKYAKKYCRDDLSKIENYEQAINDKSQTWECHHRDEIIVLPSGMIAYRSKAELIENNRYYGCPANELIFLTRAEHRSMHHKSKTLSADTRLKLSEVHKGKHHTDETRCKMSESQKGHTLSDETRRKISEAKKGHTLSDETRRKISESRKGKKRGPYKKRG